jgi:putative aldouronate transport system permease protein
MKEKTFSGFQIVNGLLLVLLALVALLPMVQTLAVSLSSNTAVVSGRVNLVPVDFTVAAYDYVASRKEYWIALAVTLKKIAIEVPLSMLVVVMTAYPLSREAKDFHGRNIYSALFIVSMYVSGGMIPTYIVITQLA